LAIETLFFFSILEQTQHLIEVTSPTSLNMGSAQGFSKPKHPKTYD
jgi:hypothetical protein